MKFISIKEAIKKGSGKVSLRGWCYRHRGSSKLTFIVLRDVTNIIQCIVEKSKVKPKNWNESQKVTIETSLHITGTIKKDERAPTGYEIIVTDLEIIGASDTYPITKDQSNEYLLEKRHLWVRSRKITSIMKIRHTVLQAFREHYINKGFYEFSPPIFQSNQSEGGSTLFEVKYYTDKTYLTQSAQLYSEAMIFGLERIFLISPCFRAEKSKTSRHLSEFWMAEMEAAWMDLDDMAKDIEEVITFIVQKVLKDNLADLEILKRDIKKLKNIKPPFPKLTYSEVLSLLKKKDNITIPWGKDLRTIEEDKLSAHFDKPVIVTNYPKDIMAFYKPKDPKNPKTALCLDVIAPDGYGEIVGGSQRDIDMGEMVKELKKMGENPENYEWYFDLRRYGSVPHSGYGLGVERVVAWLAGVKNIKETIPFPRTMLRFKP